MESESWLMRRLRSGLPRAQAITRPWSLEPAGGPHRPPGPAATKRIVVWGDDPLAYRLIEELIQQYGVHVTAILPSVNRRHGPDIARLVRNSGGQIIEADHADGDAFRRADLAGADALALVKQDDIGNLDAALQAQEVSPGLRLVIRMFNLRLGYSVRRNFADARVLSDAQMAAPAFVSEALGEVAPVHVRVARRTLFVARRAEVRAEDVICGLAVTAGDGEPVLLPADQTTADLVLAVATGERVSTVMGREDGPDTAPVRRRHRRWRWLRNPLRAYRGLVGRRLWTTAMIMLGLLAVGTAIIAHYKQISWWDAAYVTLLSELVGAGPDLQARWPEKLVTVLLSLVSIALIPVITAAVVEAVVNAKLAIALGRLREPLSDHVVLVGLGNVGTRVMHAFVDLGVPVVASTATRTPAAPSPPGTAACRSSSATPAGSPRCGPRPSTPAGPSSWSPPTTRPTWRRRWRVASSSPTCGWCCGSSTARSPTGSSGRSASPRRAACRIWPRRRSRPHCWNAR